MDIRLALILMLMLSGCESLDATMECKVVCEECDAKRIEMVCEDRLKDNDIGVGVKVK